MIYTRQYLNNLYLEFQEIDKQQRLMKTIDYIKENVIKSAKSGNKQCKTNVICKIKDIEDEILNKLKDLFPDSIIEIIHDFEEYYYIRINWE
jgi:capsid portal protein